MAELGVLSTLIDDTDLDIIGIQVRGPVVTGTEIDTISDFSRRVPVWRDPSVSGWLPATGVIAGAVTENSVAVPGCMVGLYHRPSGHLVDRTRTDASGLYSFTGLEQDDGGNYFVVAHDLEGGVIYNALIFDRLTALS